MATKKLLIVESPAKAGTIKKYLGKDYTVNGVYGAYNRPSEKSNGYRL